MRSISPDLQKSIEVHGFFFKSQDDSEHDDRIGNVIYVCLDDGGPGGFPVGHVIDQGGLWSAYAQVRKFRNEDVGRYSDFETAVRAVLANFRY